jgi:hypothetical protein
MARNKSRTTRVKLLRRSKRYQQGGSDSFKEIIKTSENNARKLATNRLYNIKHDIDESLDDLKDDIKKGNKISGGDISKGIDDNEVKSYVSELKSDIKDTISEIKDVSKTASINIQNDIDALTPDICKITSSIMSTYDSIDKKIALFDRTIIGINKKYDNLIRQMNISIDRALNDNKDVNSMNESLAKLEDAVHMLNIDADKYRKELIEGGILWRSAKLAGTLLTIPIRIVSRVMWWMAALMPRTVYMTLILAGSASMLYSYISILLGIGLLISGYIEGSYIMTHNNITGVDFLTGALIVVTKFFVGGLSLKRGLSSVSSDTSYLVYNRGVDGWKVWYDEWWGFGFK